MATFKLTALESAALLLKAGIVGSLLEAAEKHAWTHIRVMQGTFDPLKSPEPGIEPDDDDGNHVVDSRYMNVMLSGRRFILRVDDTRRIFPADYCWNYYRRDTEEYACGKCGVRVWVWETEGADIDASRVARGYLKELLESAERHLPEALDMFRKEYAQ